MVVAHRYPENDRARGGAVLDHDVLQKTESPSDLPAGPRSFSEGWRSCPPRLTGISAGMYVIPRTMPDSSVSAQKKAFDAEHVYSSAPEASAKRKLDLQIIAGNYARGHGSP